MLLAGPFAYSEDNQEKLEAGRGRPTKPTDPDCDNCYGEGFDVRGVQNIYCLCRYDESEPLEGSSD